MNSNLFRFVKNVKLIMTADFEQNTVDDFSRLIGNLYNQQKTSFDISDFAYLFKYENLTKTAKTEFIENDCNIKFTSMNVNQVLHRDATTFRLNLKVRDNLKHINVWYVVFSDCYTSYKEEDNENYYFEKDGVKYEFNKQKLMNCNISVQSI